VVEPLMDRAVIFFSESLLHRVRPSHCSRRYCLTIWVDSLAGAKVGGLSVSEQHELERVLSECRRLSARAASILPPALESTKTVKDHLAAEETAKLSDAHAPVTGSSVSVERFEAEIIKQATTLLRHSPAQRVLGRAVYAHEFQTSLIQCMGSHDIISRVMLQAHHTRVSSFLPAYTYKEEICAHNECGASTSTQKKVKEDGDLDKTNERAVVLTTAEFASLDVSKDTKVLIPRIQSQVSTKDQTLHWMAPLAQLLQAHHQKNIDKTGNQSAISSLGKTS